METRRKLRQYRGLRRPAVRICQDDLEAGIFEQIKILAVTQSIYILEAGLKRLPLLVRIGQEIERTDRWVEALEMIPVVDLHDGDAVGPQDAVNFLQYGGNVDGRDMFESLDGEGAVDVPLSMPVARASAGAR